MFVSRRAWLSIIACSCCFLLNRGAQGFSTTATVSRVRTTTEKATLETWSKQIDLPRLLAEYGSNIWIISEKQLESNLCKWIDLGGSADKIFFPVKANPSPAVLEILARNGAGAECSSPAELVLAHRAGFLARQTMYNSPAMDPHVAIDCLKSGRCVVIDSDVILQEIDALLKNVEISDFAKILLRVNPGVPIRYKKTEDWSELTSHASDTGKFGIPTEDVVSLLQKVSNIPRVDGLHVHVGTQMDHAKPFVTMSQHLYELAQEIRSQTIFKPSIINLGGGLGIPFSPNDDFPTVEALADALRPTFKVEYDYWFEPGHALVGNAVGLLGSIESKKTVRGKTWAIANVGFDSVMKISLLGWQRPVLGPDGELLPPTGQDAIAGPLCFAGDVVVPSTDVSGLEKGDPILIQHTGAYCGSCMNTFNGRRSGGTVVLRGDNKNIVVTNPPAALEDEALSNFYTWGALAQPLPKNGKSSNKDIMVAFDSQRLSSPIIKDHHETWEYISSYKVNERMYEYVIDVQNEVSFCSMPLLQRIAADATIVSIMKSRGKDSKDISVWGTASKIKLLGSVRSKRPLTLRVHLSNPNAIGANSEKVELSVKFFFNKGEVIGSFEAVYKPNASS